MERDSIETHAHGEHECLGIVDSGVICVGGDSQASKGIGNVVDIAETPELPCVGTHCDKAIFVCVECEVEILGE